MDVTHSLFADKLVVSHTVTPKADGERLDAFLKRYYRKRSREQIKRAIESGAVEVLRTGLHHSVGRLKPSSQLLSGDQIIVTSPRKPEPEVSFDYKVLFEDDVLLVIEKPGNLPVHPAGRFYFNTLLIHLRTAGFTRPMSADREFYLVHRIDRETSGILVLAKERTVATHLIRQFADRKTEKFYLAIARGRPEQEEFVSELPLGRSKDSPIKLKMGVVPESAGGQSALTSFCTLKTVERPRGPFSLIACFPKTGRQHQIRVHLAEAGHPIVGDKLYSISDFHALTLFQPEDPARVKHNPIPETFNDDFETHVEVETDTYFSVPRQLTPEMEARLILPRHALHAAGIRFQHPNTGEMLEFRSRLPKDLREFLGLSTDPEVSWSSSSNHSLSVIETGLA
jgi:23S rRNA pseudouridine1911/1915/1917 synthase